MLLSNRGDVYLLREHDGSEAFTETPDLSTVFSVKYKGGTVYFNNSLAAYNFGQFTKQKFGSSLVKLEKDIKPPVFYESLEELLMGVFWEYHPDFGNGIYRKYKSKSCCLVPLSRRDVKRGEEIE